MFIPRSGNGSKKWGSSLPPRITSNNVNLDPWNGAAVHIFRLQYTFSHDGVILHSFGWGSAGLVGRLFGGSQLIITAWNELKSASPPKDFFTLQSPKFASIFLVSHQSHMPAGVLSEWASSKDLVPGSIFFFHPEVIWKRNLMVGHFHYQRRIDAYQLFSVAKTQSLCLNGQETSDGGRCPCCRFSQMELDDRLGRYNCEVCRSSCFCGKLILSHFCGGRGPFHINPPKCEARGFFVMISSSSGVLISWKYWVGWYLGDFCDQRCSQYFFCICFPQISQF